MSLFLRSLLFTLLFPGTVTVIVPRIIVEHTHSEHPVASLLLSPLGCLGSILIVSGGAVLLHCIWDFAVEGRGTLAPIDPPKQLVVHGLYRYVRNPMYVGVIWILIGESCVFRLTNLLIYTIFVFAMVSAFIIFYEEPALTKKFGESYIAYANRVRRWVPGAPYRD